jgi:seryl-tRNA synthetase
MTDFDPARAKPIEEDTDDGLHLVLSKLERTLRNHKEQTTLLLGDAGKEFQKAVERALSDTEKHVASIAKTAEASASRIASHLESEKKSQKHTTLCDKIAGTADAVRESSSAISAEVRSLRQSMADLETRHCSEMTELKSLLKDLAARPVVTPAPEQPSKPREWTFTADRDEFNRVRYTAKQA